MKRCWNEQDLIDHWTPFEAEMALLANRTGRGRIGLAVLLKYFQLNGRFPRRHGDVPGPVLAFLGERRMLGSTTTLADVAASATGSGGILGSAPSRWPTSGGCANGWGPRWLRGTWSRRI